MYCLNTTDFDKNVFLNLKSELIKISEFEEKNRFLREKYNFAHENTKIVEIAPNKTIGISFEDSQTTILYFDSIASKGDGMIFTNVKQNVKSEN